MEKKYLTEENYQKGKKKILMISIVVLVLGLLIGVCLIVKGISMGNTDSLDNQIKEEKENLLAVKEQLEKEIATNVSSLQAQIDALNEELASLKSQKNAEFIANGLSEKYYSLVNEIDKVNEEIKELENQIEEEESKTDIIDKALDDSFDWCLFDAKDNEYTETYCSLKNQKNSAFSTFSRTAFYMFGGFIIVASIMIAVSIYLFAKRREILAFTAQQVMPVAKEGIDEMAPTVGQAAGTISKEIAKGIKEGISDEEKK